MIIEWLTKNWVEVTAAVLGVIYLLLSIKQNIWLWLFGLLTSVLYIYVFLVSKFYADMSLQAYYVVISVYGWLHWKKGGKISRELPVSASGRYLMSWLFVIWVILWIGMSTFLKFYTDSVVPIGDGFTTAGSIVATWMLARKIKEHWLFWIIIDLVSLILYIDKGLYATSGLFVIYTSMAVVGYFEWLRDYKKRPVRQKLQGFSLSREEIIE